MNQRHICLWLSLRFHPRRLARLAHTFTFFLTLSSTRASGLGFGSVLVELCEIFTAKKGWTIKCDCLINEVASSERLRT